jgi:oxygen-dependent protoporphyrinogen oxidase
MSEPRRIVIVGAGLSGLAAAHRLQELSVERQVPLDIVLVERGPCTGGAVGTIREQGYLVDTGADSFLTNKPGAVSLCRRLGIEDRLIPTDTRYRGALVLYDGRPVPVPDGFQLLSPTALWPMVTTPLLSPWGKLRLFAEYFVPPAKNLSDESLASFVRRRLGAEALDRLVQPLVGGIYTSDPETLSLAATIPRFLEMEQRHGSLIRAALADRKKPSAESSDRTSSGARYGLFAGLKGGLQDLVDALTTSISAKCAIRLGTRVTSLKPTGTGWRLGLSTGEWWDADGVLLTLPTHAASELVDDFDKPLAGILGEIDYASSAIVVTGHKLANVRHPLNAFGLVIPERERRKILAVSFSSRKFPDRAPEGRVLLRTFVGGALHPEAMLQTDEEMIATVREELAETLGVTGEPDFAKVCRYVRAMPQYTLGHLDRVVAIEAGAKPYRGLELAGTGYRGVGIPDAIEQAEQAAERLLEGP